MVAKVNWDWTVVVVLNLSLFGFSIVCLPQTYQLSFTVLSLKDLQQSRLVYGSYIELYYYQL